MIFCISLSSIPKNLFKRIEREDNGFIKKLNSQGISLRELKVKVSLGVLQLVLLKSGISLRELKGKSDVECVINLPRGNLFKRIES